MLRNVLSRLGWALLDIMPGFALPEHAFIVP
uniref:Uncharacterized protein n=1 Tax=Anguilla anguilla TaxID=7936 RepID=A0A0E9UHT8_ANGAN